jgi:hypothetical protein
MNRRAHLLCAISLTTACFACVQLQRAPFSGKGTGLASCTAQQFADAVQVLSTNSFPDAWLIPPSVPTSPLNSSTQIWKDLFNAFNAAPPNFQQQLCLTTVYINPTSCSGPKHSCVGANSWGLRYPYDITQHYVALSQSLWDGGGQAPSLSTFETNIFAEVMQQQGMPWPTASATVPGPPAFSPAMNVNTSGITTSVDTPAMAVLAALSHEYGHTLWYDVFKQNYLIYNPNGFHCKAGGGFFDNAWNTPVNIPTTWLDFAVTTNDQHASGTVQIGDLYNAIVNKPDLKEAARRLNELYDSDKNGNRSGVWPSLFGAISPPEDFVETFKIYILTNLATNMGMPVTSMPLNIYSTPGVNAPTYTPNIFANLYTNPIMNKKELARKRSCVDAAFSSITPAAR